VRFGAAVIPFSVPQNDTKTTNAPRVTARPNSAAGETNPWVLSLSQQPGPGKSDGMSLERPPARGFAYPVWCGLVKTAASSSALCFAGRRMARSKLVQNPPCPGSAARAPPPGMFVDRSPLRVGGSVVNKRTCRDFRRGAVAPGKPPAPLGVIKPNISLFFGVRLSEIRFSFRKPSLSPNRHRAKSNPFLQPDNTHPLDWVPPKPPHKPDERLAVFFR